MTALAAVMVIFSASCSSDETWTELEVPDLNVLKKTQEEHHTMNRVLTKEQSDSIWLAESSEDMLQKLESMPAGVHSRLPDTYSTFLHSTASRAGLEGNIPADMLIASGADVNAIDGNGSTPLHNAATSGNLEVAQLLIENGAKVDAVNSYGLTPLMEVCAWNMHRGNLKEMVELLIDAGANVNAYIPKYKVQDGEARTAYDLLKENWEQWKHQDAKLILDQWHKPPSSLR